MNHHLKTFVMLLVLGLAHGTNAQNLRVGESRFYEIHTNLAGDEATTLARHMDEVFTEYRKRFSGFRAKHAGRMPLYLFKTDSQYQTYLATHGVNATNSGGMFFIQPDIEGLATWVRGHNRTRTFRTLQHEGFHQFAWNYLGTEPPPWVNEGLAEYFEDGIVTGSGMELGLVNQRRLNTVRRAMADNRVVDIHRVLSIDAQQWGNTLKTNPDRAHLLYAQSWSMVYFLIHGDHGRYRDAFEQYLKLVSAGRNSEDAFEQAFGTDDLSVMENRWRAHVKRVKPDPLSTAIGNLEFLAMGLEELHQREIDQPHSLHQLKELLQKGRFTVVYSSHGLNRREKASDDSLYTYEQSRGRVVPFELLDPAADNLPPRLTAPGLRPQPTLTWTRAENDELTSRIKFR